MIIENKFGTRKKYNFKGGLLRVFRNFTILDRDLVTLETWETFSCVRVLYPYQTFIVREKDTLYHYNTCFKCTHILGRSNIYIGGYYDCKDKKQKYRRLSKKHIESLKKIITQ